MTAFNMKVSTVTAMLALLPHVCLAGQEYGGEKCPQKSQYEINQCEGRLADKADADLTAVYGALYKARRDDAQPDDHIMLNKAELAWIAFRDKQCEWAGNRSKGGTIHGEIIAECKLKMTKQRIAELNKLLTCRDNDVFCGVE